MLRSLSFFAGLMLAGASLAQTATPPATTPEAAPAAAAAPAPKVVLHTNMGDITLELYPDKAPKSVENFLQYVKDKHYDGTIFHRVIDGFMVQGGGFNDKLQQKPTRAPVPNEADNGLSNRRGTVAMARTNDPNSATAQFFINVVDNTRLDHVSKENGFTWGYAVFGKVVDGMDVVDRIKSVETSAAGPFQKDVPKTPVLIDSAEVLP
jgi:cyclophilin family peptidyl-prolyl cis-trans isomerase